MIQLRPGYEADYEGRPPVFAVGCAGVITDFEQLPDCVPIDAVQRQELLELTGPGSRSEALITLLQGK
jgi:Lon protease-like protein